VPIGEVRTPGNDSHLEDLEGTEGGRLSRDHSGKPKSAVEQRQCRVEHLGKPILGACAQIVSGFRDRDRVL
jgi:hypothetical protein